MINKYWLQEHHDKLATTTSFKEIGAVALTVARSLPQPIGQVCGPISTGGYGSLEKNLEAFEKTITALVAKGKNVFNQIPLEDSVFRIRNAQGDAYNWKDLLNDIYLPLFKSGLIKELYFMHDWESSRGSRWEHYHATTLGIGVHYLPFGFGMG